MNTCQLLQIPITEELSFSEGLHNPYNIHKMIWKLWDGSYKKLNKKRPFLFRVKNNRINILLSSDINNTSVEFLKDSFMSKKINIDISGTIEYEVVVNPVKKINSKEHKNRKIVALTKDQEIISWWQEQGKNHGFDLIDGATNIQSKDKIYFKKDDTNSASVSIVCIHGYLQITDKEKFNKSFIEGFGRSKFLGCGMMIVKRIIK